MKKNNNVKNFKEFVNENSNIFEDKSIKFYFSINKFSETELMLRIETNSYEKIDKLLDKMKLFDEISDLLNTDEISGNFGKYTIEYNNNNQINDIIQFLEKKGFILKKNNNKNNNKFYYGDIEKISDNKFCFYTSSKKNMVTGYDYVKIGKFLENILKNYLKIDGNNYVMLNEMENFHIITFDNNEYLNNVFNLIKTELNQGDF